MSKATPDLSRYDAVLIDLDGTLYKEQADGAHVLPGAVELIKRLRDRGQRFACLTNSGASPVQLSQRLAGFGAAVEEERIWSCSAAACQYVLQRFGSSRRPRVLNLASEGTHALLEGRADWVNSADEACDAVMVAAPINVRASPDRQWVALQLLRRGATLVGQCADRVFPSHRGLEFGAGALTEMLAYAANVRPVYCGKPERVFFEFICARLGVKPGQCVLVGDNLDSDVAGAKAVGMDSILVLGGVSTRQDVARLDPPCRPEFTIDSLLDLT
jgi:4-nitrophenyl phosphatase